MPDSQPNPDSVSADSPQKSSSPAASVSPSSNEQVLRIVVEPQASNRRGWGAKLLTAGLLFSVFLNMALFSAYGKYFSVTEGPREQYHSGDKTASQKIAVISLGATIMPPFTERILQQIEKVSQDEQVLGVVLEVDSPGGLVADSHQIYHQLTLLAQKKPIYVQMKRIAASGGYYIAMGAGEQGRIFAEPTTWTGSIGVIIPHYDFTGVAEKIGVKSEPLTTGEFKDSLSSFKPLSEREREVWDGILDNAFQRFLGVIAAGRPKLSRTEIEEVATGRIFTADQALENGLIDEIGYTDQTIEALKQKLDLTTARIVKYQYPPTLSDYLLGAAQTRSEVSLLRELLQSPAPRAFYLMGR